MNEKADLLHTRVVAAAVLLPAQNAIEVGGESITYQNMVSSARSIAATLEQNAPTEPRFTALYGGKSISTYCGLLGTLLRGNAYVPLSLFFPPILNRELIERCGAKSIIVDGEGATSLGPILDGLQHDLTILCLESSDCSQLQANFPRHHFLHKGELLSPELLTAPERTSADLAYVLFTSGSTGRPKGVPVSHSSIVPLIDSLIARHRISHYDRITQVNDLTFDLSVAEMFTTWFSGATLCPLSRSLLLNLTGFLKESRVSVIHTAPSIGLAAHKVGRLIPNCLPDLRVSIFAGEALPIAFANMWCKAAPNSLVDNLYGPTECAVYVTGYQWDPQSGVADVKNGTVPIGYPLPGVTILVVDEKFQEVPPGEQGELLLGGPQVASGYLGDPERTNASFIVPPGQQERFYRTGDVVRRPTGRDPLFYFGRRDHQIKILGMRIELGQIDAALREASGVMEVAALGWPPLQTGYGGVVAFIGSDSCDIVASKCRLGELLHKALVPKQIFLMKELPLTTSGKVDKNKLQALLETRLCK